MVGSGGLYRDIMSRVKQVEQKSITKRRQGVEKSLF